ncbi:MAG: Y-family DNA polymerase [Patescibacteria group bacterium]|nr:Y-family DNA polymerase [Patescibacteria group bacterium]
MNNNSSTNTSQIYALLDCNNFYVSCERVFAPELNNIPIMVLSNNDGCVIARSNEVKALGVKMAEPAFKCRDLVRKHNIQVFSANFPLYADLSARVMKTLRKFTPEIEIYSIDEAFLSFSNLHISDYQAYSQKIRQTILRWTGLPVSIGIASTKTLTKAANEIAKKDPSLNGVLDFTRLLDKEVDDYLERIPVRDIWGVGRQYSKKLEAIGIYTAKNLKHADSKYMRKKMTVLGERCVLELRGERCFDLDTNPQPQKGISTTRTFGGEVTDYQDLEEAIASFTATASEKLRNQNSLANIVIVFVRTNRFKGGYYSNSYHIRLPKATSSTILLTKYALLALRNIFKKGYRYKQSGVLLSGIEPEVQKQTSIFKSDKSNGKAKTLMNTIDAINRKWGRGQVKLLSEGIRKPWLYQRTRVSKRYTTDWGELLIVSCNP